MQAELEQKYDKLVETIRSYQSAIVALSGGIDSSLVAYIAGRELGDKALAVTSASESLKQGDLALAKEITGEWGLAHRVIRTREIDNINYLRNPENRCYYCKSTLYTDLAQIAREENFRWVVNGTNKDDTGDYRPGLKAADEFDVKSPLLDCSFNKQDIRTLATQLKLKNASKPAAACLSSRVPYGTAISSATLSQIENAEQVLAELGLSQFRVRHHGEVARLEVLEEELPLVIANRVIVESRLRQLGYRYVALDLRGFRSGSLKESILASSRS